MKENLYNKIKVFSNFLPINFYTLITGQKILLPFYHTVTDYPKPHLSEIGYFRPKKLFIEDVLFFKKYYQSIPINELKTTSKKSFHLTFDDGLSEIYTEILPILIKENIHATFFINTDFIDNKKMFYRHKISIILNQLRQSNVDVEKISSFLEIEKDVIFKSINALKEERKINQIANYLKIDFQNYLKEHQPYLTTEQLIELKNKGFTIANHSKNHPNFKNISFLEQQNQINQVNKYLENELYITEFYFSFPFGDENIKKDFFDFMYNQAKIILSFGISGLKKDEFKNHLHRIPMEEKDFSAEQIIKFEYFYFILKSFINKNMIKR